MFTQIYKRRYDRLTEGGCYWKKNGALEYARLNQDLIKLDKFGWLSLHYGAASSAWKHWCKNPFAFWWLWRFATLFPPAFFKAREFSESLDSLNAEQCSVVGAILARGGLRDLAVRAFEHGISQTDVSFETQALLYVDLYVLHAMSVEHVWVYVWGTTSAPDEATARKPSGPIESKKLAHILNKIGLHNIAKKVDQEVAANDQVLKESA